MLLSNENLMLLCFGFFIIATLYSSVGFGGGSSYLALLTLFLSGFYEIRSIALICNLVVVSSSTFLYFKHGHAKLKDFFPFILTSIPLAFLGATFKLSEQLFFIILGLSLIISSLALVIQTLKKRIDKDYAKKYPAYFSYGIGGVIGFISGLVGIGGGIFLAPLLNHFKWNSAIKIAALASFFILVNSISGLGGLVASGTLELPIKEAIVLIVAVFIGGQVGIRISLKRLTPNDIKRITAFLVFIVGMRVLLKNGLEVL